MSLKSDKARIEFISMLISDIDLIIIRHTNIEAALNDREGFHALMMCLMQIGETMSKIEDSKIADKLPVSLSSGLRNIIAHDYLGLSTKRISDTINKSIPELKNIINTLNV